MATKVDRLRSYLSQIAPGGNTESMLPDNDPEYSEHIATRDLAANGDRDSGNGPRHGRPHLLHIPCFGFSLRCPLGNLTTVLHTY